jgi:hypothetical protein
LARNSWLISSGFSFRLSVHKPGTNFHWRDASEVIQWKFDGKILCWYLFPLQLIGQLNEDSHESLNELCRNYHRLLMWRVSQGLDIHGPKISSSSSIFHVVGPLDDPFRSHMSRSLFKGPSWFLLPVGE